MPDNSAHNLNPVDGDRGRTPRRRRLSLVILLLGCAGFALMMFADYGGAATSAAAAAARGQFSPAGSDPLAPQTGDFSKFSHERTHSALPCLLCHRRESGSPRPQLPGHTPCAGCHAQSFADSRSPICTICHTDVGAGSLKSFPGLKSFNMKFDHARHLPSARCATCHQPQRRGVALSIPAGAGAHSTCFQCHTERAKSSAGGDISSCATCHSAGGYARTSTAAQSYNVNFSHAKHGARQRLSCQDCHNVKAGMPQRRQVTAPAPLMHHANARAQSCASCHNNKRAFGIENFADCKRCHQQPHFYF